MRALRGAAAALIAVLFASTAHTLSGGGAPPLWLVAAVTILATPVCIALVGRRRRLTTLAAAVAAAQLALHGAFAAVGDAAPAAGHHHDMAMLGAAAVDPAAATMTLGHALAALASLVVLAWGEALVAAVARGIRRLLPLLLTVPAPHPIALPRVGSARAHAPAPVFLVSVTRRGPPARLAPASFA